MRLLADGDREDEVALALDFAMRRLGAEDRAFETIVASGPNAAKPHARPTGRASSPVNRWSSTSGPPSTATART